MLSPYRGFRDVRSEMEQMFDEVFNLARRPRQGRSQVAEWAPAMDVLSQNGDLVVRVELPGIKQEDVDITIQNGVLNISGEHTAEREEERGGYYMRERRRGAFRRSLPLPEGVDESKIRARFQDGVLEVTVQGAAAVKEPKRIEIEGEEGAES
ncbi:MAG: Hsp20/alpha crystallin family protein [Rubrobacteraceae bacterium]